MPATIQGAHLGPGDHASRPAANAAGQPFGALYSCTDHALIYKTDGATWATYATLGTVGSGVATDTIWDAAGDLAVGTGANAAGRLAIGATNGMALRRVSGAVAWALPPGHELDYVQFTSDVNLTGTNEAGADTIVTGTSQSYAAVPIMVEFFTPDVGVGSTGGAIVVLLYDGGTVLGRLGVEILAAGQRIPIRATYRLTPTAATHQYIVKAYGPATGTPFVGGGAGGTGASLPGFIRVTLV
jgi:hypothetical protein